MTERTGLVTVGGAPITLTGQELKVGDPAPDCDGVGNNMATVQLSSFRGKVLILSFVSSLDTETCSLETRRFNQEAAALGDDVAIVTVSMDLPFAQKRWCAAAGVDNVITISDYKDRCMAEHYGVMIKESGLHARSVFVIDKQGKVRYNQLVPEIADEPDYGPILEHAKKYIEPTN